MVNQRRGLLITFEGVDGCGKTTQRQRLENWLKQRGHTPLIVREPGGTRLGEAIRHLLLGEEGEAPVAEAELLLFLASRAQLCACKIRPALQAGEIVLCDRFTDSTLAYQGGARGLGVKRLRDLNDQATGGLIPDLTLVFDLDPAQALARRKGRAEKQNRLDKEALAFQEAVRKTYHELCQGPDRARMVCLDASLPEDEIFNAVCEHVQPLLDALE